MKKQFCIRLNPEERLCPAYDSCSMKKFSTSEREEMGVPVCDCYAEWKKLSETEDMTMLLCNRINHPTKEMHELFARKLFEMIFADKPEVVAPESSTMYKG